MHTFKSLYFNLCFFIITILFFLYYYFIFTFNVNPFLGGYFTVVTVSLTPLLIFFSGIRYSGIELFYLFGYFCFAMVGAYHFGAGKDMAGFELEMLLYTVVGVLNNVFVFYLFKNLTYVFSDGSFKYALISLLFMCFVMFFNLNTVNVFDPRSENINVSTYLMFSFMYVLLYFYVLSYFSAYYSWKLFYLTLAIGLFFVFISGSKANFIFLVVSLCIYFIYVKRISFLNPINTESPCKTESLDRSSLWIMETPQVSRKDWLLEGIQLASNKKIQATDEVSLLELIGKKVSLLTPPYPNPKLTSVADLPYFKFLIPKK